jgi:hypothetical protein
MEINIQKVKNWMRKNKEEFRDNQTGELNYTLLAEACANELDIYSDDNYNIPEELFELAVELE